jgi:hypothetical protein
MEVQGEGEDTGPDIGPNSDNVILGGCVDWLVVAAAFFWLSWFQNTTKGNEQ